MARVLGDTEEKSNFSKLSRLLVDGGTTALRNVFHKKHPNLAASLKSHIGTLRPLYNRRVLNPDQWDTLFPPSGNPDSSNFDITLLFVLLRNICSFARHAKDPYWNKLPPASDTSDEAALTRIKFYRNKVYGHVTTTAIQSADFEHYWTEISGALVSLGLAKEEIDELKSAPLGTNDYFELLKQWWESDVELANVINALDEKIENVGNGVGQMKEELIVLKENVTTQIKDVGSVCSDVSSQIKEELENMTTQIKRGTSEITSEIKALKRQKTEALPLQETATQTSTGTQGSAEKTPLIERFIESLKQKYAVGENTLIGPLPDMEDFADFTLDKMFTELKITQKDTDTEVNMDEVFKTNNRGEKNRGVLLLGNPGAGKTTSCHKLAYDWAKGKSQYSELFNLVLILKCRSMIDGSIWTAMQEQLLPDETSDEERREIFEYIKSNQQNMLIILDGFDEISTTATAMESLSKVISKNALPLCYTLVTSRHERSNEIQKHFHPSSVLEGKGLANVGDYLAKFFDSSEDRAFFLTSTVFSELFRNPLNIALLCVLYVENKDRLTALQDMTIGELYQEIVFCITKRYCKKMNREVDDDILLNEFRPQHLTLGKFAFDALIKGETSFTVKQLSREVWKELGFVVKEKSPKATRKVNVYSFPHKSIQDYFGALYVADELLKGNMDCIDQFDNFDRNFESISRYNLAAMIERNQISDVVKILAPKLSKNYQKNYHNLLYQCLGELNGHKDFNHTIEIAHRHLPTHLKFWIPRNCSKGAVLGLCSLLSHKPMTSHDTTWHKSEGVTWVRSFEVRSFCFDGNDIDRDNITCNIAKSLQVNSTFTKLEFYFGIRIGGPGMRAVADLLRINTTLTDLSITLSDDVGGEYDALEKILSCNKTLEKLSIYGYSRIKDTVANSIFARGLDQNTSLKELTIRGDYIFGTYRYNIANAISINTSVVFLDISQNELGVDEAKAIANMLKQNRTLKKLRIANNDIGDNGAIELSVGLSKNEGLERLDIEWNNIGDKGMCAIANMLIQNKTLKELWIGNNDIGDNGAIELSVGLSKNEGLERLCIVGNNIGDKGMCAIANMLKQNRTLKELRIAYNDMGDNGAIELSVGLSKNEGLERLDIERNNIGDKGMCAIAEAVIANTCLKVIYIGANDITEIGAKAIASACAESKSLPRFPCKYLWSL